MPLVLLPGAVVLVQPNSGVEQMVWALCVSVLMTLYLAAILWLLSHGRYRSVWVGFLYTPIVKLPSSSGLMIVSRKGMEPSSFASSTVNWIEGSTVLMCWRNCCWCFCCCIYQGIINIPSPNSRGCSAVAIALCSKASMKMLAMIGLMGDPMAAPLVCS